jgi:flagellar motor protein MotB
MVLRIYIKIDNTGEMRVSGSSSANARSLLIVFFILTVAFSLTSAGIFRSNNAIGIAAYAAKSKGSSGGSSNGGGGGDKCGSTKKSTVSKGRSSPTPNEEKEEKQESQQEQQ